MHTYKLLRNSPPPPAPPHLGELLEHTVHPVGRSDEAHQQQLLGVHTLGHNHLGSARVCVWGGGRVLGLLGVHTLGHYHLGSVCVWGWVGF